MKKLTILFVCLMLLPGCKAGEYMKVFQSLEQADRAIVTEYTGNPALDFAAKRCEDTENLAMITEILTDIKIKEKTDTIYGGASVTIVLFAGEEIIYRIYVYGEDYVSVNGECYTYSNGENFFRLYEKLTVPEVIINGRGILC